MDVGRRNTRKEKLKKKVRGLGFGKKNAPFALSHLHGLCCTDKEKMCDSDE